MVSGQNQSRHPNATSTSFGHFFAREEDDRRQLDVRRSSHFSGSTEHEYDKFLSFGGSDTRKGIADNICTRLVDVRSTAPIFVSRDAEDHQMGSQLRSQLLDSIAWSKISIPILSENYAASEWFLCKLVQMVENRESTGDVLMPIYDGVENLTGSFGEAFHSHKMGFEQRDMEAGQQALRDVSFLKGWESGKIANGHQGEYVRIVVETVLSELRQGFQVDVPEALIGIDDRMKKRNRLLDSMRSIGIYGMGGIGKTTLTFE